MGASYAEELIRVKILPDVDRNFQIGASVGDQDRVETLLFLIQNVDVFAWSPYKVLGLIPNSSSTSSMWILHFLKRSKN